MCFSGVVRPDGSQMLDGAIIMGAIIIDGTCRERSLYCDRIAKWCGWPVMQVKKNRDIQWYYDAADREWDGNVIIDGFCLAHDPGWNQRDLAYTCAHLGNSLHVHYMIVQNVMQHAITHDFDFVVRSGHCPSVVLASDGLDVGYNPAGTIRHQEKNFTVVDERYHAERAALYELYGR